MQYKFYVKMDGETEDLYAYGDTLMYAGVHLKQGFAGTGVKKDMLFSVPDRKGESVFCLPWRRHIVVNEDGNGCHFVFLNVSR